MLHTSSLLHYPLSPCSNSSIDDIEDNSSLRRGFPVAHSIYGVPQTLNCANYMYFCALRELQRLDDPQVVKVFTGTKIEKVQ